MAMKRKQSKNGLRIGRLLSMLLITCIITMEAAMPAFAAGSGGSESVNTVVSEAVTKTAQYMINTVANPQISMIGGEWVIIGLARSGANVPESYYDQYFNNVLSEITSKKGNLSSVKYSEYSRLILALTAIDKDVRNVGGYNLLEKLADYNQVVKQGINGPIFALIALDSKNYAIPEVKKNPVQTTRQKLIDYILAKEITDGKGVRGGFALTGDTPDADVTGMALQALSNYQNQPEVKAAMERAGKILSDIQLPDGGYESHSAENTESIAQVITAKTVLGIDATPEVSALMRFYLADGGFSHTIGGAANQMASEQGFYALVAYDRYARGKNTLYDMKDAGEPDDNRTAEDHTIKVSLNGSYLLFPQEPVNKEGRILVPMRAIFEAMGAEVAWERTEKKVTGTRGDVTIELVIGKQTAKINEEEKALDVPACIINGSTMVPIRFISESLNAEVEWQKDTKTVVITYK